MIFKTDAAFRKTLGLIVAGKALTVAAVLAAGLFTSPTAQAEMSKQDIEKIVHDYIAANGELILKSVDDYQTNSMKERYADAVEKYHDDIFRDERSPFIGNPTGDVTLVEFFDYNCGYCKRAFADLKAVADADKNLKVVFKDLPILGPTSETGARYALAAQKQGKYFEFHQKLMESSGPISEESLAAIGKDLGLDAAKLKADSESTEILVQIEKNRNLATQMGISGTPAFVIGDEVVPGAVPKDELAAKIEAARKAKPAKAAPKKEEDKKEEKK